MVYLSVLPAGFPAGSVVKNAPAVWETQVRSLGWEDPLEEEMATHTSILAQRILWAGQPWFRKESNATERTGELFTEMFAYSWIR